MPPPKATGRPRAYCSQRCRSEAWRDRVAYGWADTEQAEVASLQATTLAAIDAELTGLEPATPLEQLTRAVQETEMLAVQYRRLAGKTPRNLGWRADGMAQTLAEGLTRYFPRKDPDAGA